MKFKCKISREKLPLLHGLVSTISKIRDTATITIVERFFRISTSASNLTDPSSPRCYGELNSLEVFDEYSVTSRSDNLILLELSLHLFMRALSSGKQGHHRSKITLVKRGELPFLSIESKTSATAAVFDICHDIPVKLIHPRDLPYIQPPNVSSPVLGLEIPSHKTFLNIVDKLKKISNTAYLTGEGTGRLCFAIEEPGVTIKTFCHGLKSHLVEDQETLQQRRSTKVKRKSYINKDGVTVVKMGMNLKQLSVSLDFHLLPYDTATLHFIPREAFLLHIQLSPVQAGSLTYYLTPLVDPDEDFQDNDDVEVEDRRDVTESEGDEGAECEEGDGHGDS